MDQDFPYFSPNEGIVWITFSLWEVLYKSYFPFREDCVDQITLALSQRHYVDQIFFSSLKDCVDQTPSLRYYLD